MASTDSQLIQRLTPLLKYDFLAQLVLNVIKGASGGVGSILAMSEICRTLVSISMLVFIEVDQNIRSTRNAAREARRAAINVRLKSLALEK
jgi:hypothetical protein